VQDEIKEEVANWGFTVPNETMTGLSDVVWRDWTAVAHLAAVQNAIGEYIGDRTLRDAKEELGGRERLVLGSVSEFSDDQWSMPLNSPYGDKPSLGRIQCEVAPTDSEGLVVRLKAYLPRTLPFDGGIGGHRDRALSWLDSQGWRESYSPGEERNEICRRDFSARQAEEGGPTVEELIEQLISDVVQAAVGHYGKLYEAWSEDVLTAATDATESGDDGTGADETD